MNFKFIFSALLTLVSVQAFAVSGTTAVLMNDADAAKLSTVAVRAKLDTEALGFCSGVLVHPQVVLTNSHCAKTAKGEPKFVVFGSDITSPAAIASAVAIKKFIPMKVFDGLNPTKPTYGDIALVLLAQPAPANYMIAKIDGVNVSTPASFMELGQSYQIAGYGVFDNKGTRGVLHSINVPSQRYFEAQSRSTAYWANSIGYSVGSGDSGSPVILNYKGQNVVKALHVGSFTDEDPKDENWQGGPIFHFSLIVRYYADWIKTTAAAENIKL